nr:MAG: hypothetical protein 3 [Leviviridae sp.]
MTSYPKADTRGRRRPCWHRLRMPLPPLKEEGMKSLTSLWSRTAEDLAVRCCTSATRDITYVAGRVEHEGLSFLAITLADYGKAIQKWLDRGLVVPSDCPAFKRAAGSRSGLPAFLSGFLGRVFDPCSGALLECPDIEAIYALRQLTLGFSKIASPQPTREGEMRTVVTPSREREAMLGFIQCEQEIRDSDKRLPPSELERFSRIAELLFGSMFRDCENQLALEMPRPKHGPGAVADRLSSNGKYNQRTWTTRLQQYFRAEDYIVPNPAYNSGFREPVKYSQSASVVYKDFMRRHTSYDVDFLEPGAELPVRVITVPKTLKTPRIIAIEPTCMQYVQQALFAVLRGGFERDDFLSSAIGIDDQEPNRVMARQGSLSGDLATLDLSEASDRVSNQHVRALFASSPLLLEAVQACRSRKADVPGHGVIRLAKFASMGSALCFPVEAMVFLTVILCGIERRLNAPLSRRDALALKGQVRVFGDDLIVPKDSVLSVVEELHAFGHKVNLSKSFWTGKFRESCGREYYDGHDVSIVKVRTVLPTQRQDVTEVISAVSLRNQYYWSGLWASADWMDNHLRKVLKHFPNVAPTSSVLGRESALGYQFQKLDPSTHSPLVKGFYVRAEPPPDPLEGSGALLKCLLRLENQFGHGFKWSARYHEAVSVASADTEHLERSGRPERVSIKLGERSPF